VLRIRGGAPVSAEGRYADIVAKQQYSDSSYLKAEEYKQRRKMKENSTADIYVETETGSAVFTLLGTTQKILCCQG